MVMDFRQETGRKRIPALDALRGMFALLVVIDHTLMTTGAFVLSGAAHFAVLFFFILSGFVLARSYDGRFLNFIVRRLIRLWPLYAICIVCGSIIAGKHVAMGNLVWWPQSEPDVDPPAWTLYYEAWAIPLLPVVFYLASLNRSFAIILTALSLTWWHIDSRLTFAPFFVAGVAAAQFDIPFPTRIPRPALWLGQISFSLYLTHQIVLNAAVAAFGPSGAVASLPAVVLIAWAAWWAIEQPSIALSRRVGKT